TKVTQADPFAGNVYVAWVSNDTPQAGNPLGTNFNPNRVLISSSSDGGNSFTPYAVVNDNGNFGTQRNLSPQLVVSQGSVDGRVPPGRGTPPWVDNGPRAPANPPRSILETDRVVDGGAASIWSGTAGTIGDAFDPGNSQPHVPTTTDFTASV